jgi:DNA-directed RNA polymerase specialized sigma24 family protein
MQVHSTIPSVFLRPAREHVGRKQDSNPLVGFDEAAFETLVCQYAERVRTLAFALLGSEKMSDEACLRVFSRASAALPKRGEPWIELTRLSLAECRRLRWSAAIWRYLHQCQSGGQTASPEAPGIRLLQRLPWNRRILLALREVGDLSVDQVSSVLERSIEDVRAELLSARLQLVKTVRGTNEKKY